MPELPEVETVRRSLLLKVKNRKIINVNIIYPKTIAYPDLESFINNIVDKTIIDIKRRGKFLMFDLDDYYLLSHLRMEGKYFIKTDNDPILKHEHIIFELDNGCELRYMDVRKFGKMYLIEKSKVNDMLPLKDLGLEPWDKNLTIDYLKNKYKKKKKPIKSILLEQSIITGIGNIYADEILFLSKINPLTLANELTDIQLDNIINNTRKVLEDAIKMGGTTIRSYTSVDGVHGLFQQKLCVHGRVNQPCDICKNFIVKIKVNGRGTYYCPICQGEK